MSDFARNHDFSVKDGLSSGNPSKLIKGSEVDAEFDDIVTMSSTKANKVVPTAAGNIATLSASGDLQDSGSSSAFDAGTKMLFYANTAPTGWTIATGLDDYMLRIVSGTGAGGGQGGTSGGSDSPILMNKVPSHTHTGSTGNQSQNHSHSVSMLAADTDSSFGGKFDNATGGTSGTQTVTSGVNNANHTHSVTTVANVGAANWTPKYASVIRATKD